LEKNLIEFVKNEKEMSPDKLLDLMTSFLN